MKKEERVIAILLSDMHLSEKPPQFRSAESDWFAVQRRMLDEIKRIQSKYSTVLCRLPIIFAGDLFDKWNSNANLINFALDILPEMYAIPGQHDLPYHSYKDIERSSFYTLVKAGKVILIEPEKPIELNTDPPIRLWGFPYGFKIMPLKTPSSIFLEVVSAHQFCWIQGHSHPEASKKDWLPTWTKKLEGYDVAVIGDNHSGFKGKAGNCLVWVNGLMQRRKSDEIKLEPSVGLLYSDGSIKRHKLDCSQDKYFDANEIAHKISDEMDLESLCEELMKLSDASISFAEAIHAAISRKGVSGVVKKIVMQALESASQS
jgi:hypothetical protein